ncbi:MAG: MFS transporter [Candidatus Nanoarchaeia archaeon]|nr:MFS transporter [Candidatus Nanoarchaeia archaeon]
MGSNYKSNLWKIYLFKFLAGLHFFSAVLIPFFTDWGKISFTQIMILQSWFMMCVFILEVPTGAIADYIGRKYSLILAAVTGAAASIVYVSSPNFYIFMIAEFLFAISAALISGADEAFVYDTLKKIKQENLSKKIFGRIESFNLAGILIAAPIGSIIAVQFGLSVPMLLFAVPSVLAAIIGLTLNEPQTTKKIESKRYILILKSGINSLRNNKTLRILAVDAVVISALAYLLIWLYQPMLIKAGMGIGYFGIIHASFVISEILILNNFEKLERLLGSKKRLTFFSAMIVGIMYIIGGLTTFIPVVILIIIIAGGFGLTRGTLLSSYMNKYISSEERATTLSSISMLRRFLIAAINPLIGFMVDWSLGTTLIIIGVITIIFSLFSRIKEEHLID